MVKTLSSNAKGAGLIPGWGAKILHVLGPKSQNNIVTNSIKTKNNGPQQKKNLKKFFKIMCNE